MFLCLAKNIYIYCCLSVSIFVYRNLKYNTINIDQYKIDYIIEACAIEFDSAYNKLHILAIINLQGVVLQISLIDWTWFCRNIIIANIISHVVKEM